MFQDYITSMNFTDQFAIQEDLDQVEVYAEGNKSVYTSFWMGGKVAIEGLWERKVPVEAQKEGLLQCLASCAEELRVVYEKVVQKEGGVKPEVSTK